MPLKKILKWLVFTGLTGMIVLVRLPGRAQTATTVAVTPASQNVFVGDSATVTIEATTEIGLGAYQVDLRFDPTILQVTGVNDGGFLGSTSRSVVPLTPIIDNLSGQVTVGAVSFGSNQGPTGTGILVNLTFSTAATGTSPLALTNVTLTQTDATVIPATSSDATLTVAELIPSPLPSSEPPPLPTPTLDPSPSPAPSPTPTSQPSPTPTVEPSPTPIISPEPTATPIASPLPSASPSPLPTPTLTPTPSPTPSGELTARLSFRPLNPLVVVDSEIKIAVDFSTETAVTGVDVVVMFDPRKLTAERIEDNHLFPVTPLAEINNGNGVIRFSQVTNVGSPFSGAGTLANLIFTPKTEGEMQLAFDYTAGSKADSNAIAAASGQDILALPEPLLLTAVEPADLTLTLTTPSESTISGHIVTGALTDQASTWSAEVTTNVNGISPVTRLDNGFINILKNFYFKVSGFLRKAFSLTVQPGVNQVNLGALKAGDLNDDGMINTIDLALMYEAWFGAGTADYNRDGIVNSADHWILIQNYF